MATTFTLAHLSDIHLGPLPRIGLRHLNAKRSLGFLNWHRNRKHAHLRATLDLITADVASEQPDHIAVTGDLANIGLPAEYAAAQRWLESLGPPERVTVVPGNHDIYTHLRGDPGHERWRSFMSETRSPGHVGSVAGAPHVTFPFVRRFPGIAIIGVNSAMPTRPFYAGGRVGAVQLERLKAALSALGRQKVIRIVLIHHPPLVAQAKRWKSLEDASRLEGILTSHGAELVLHGHYHTSMTAILQSERGPVAIVGVPSASLGITHESEHLARYHLFRINVSQARFSIELVARGLAEPGGTIVEIERRQLVAWPVSVEPSSSQS